MKSIVRSILLFSILCLLLPKAIAIPYASGISNNAGTVTFTLNEAADNVTVSFDGGASTLNMGALAAGNHSFSLGAATSYAIEVRKNAPAIWTQIGADSVLTRYFSARGLAVNTFPGSRYFGRIYVANGGPGTTTVGPAPHRFTGDGIYILNPDMTDALGQGTNARNASLNFAPATNAGDTPFRIEVGKDGRLYIADYSTTTGNIYRTDPDVSTSEPVFEGQGTGNPSVHTTIAAPRIFGTIEDGDLVVWAIDGNTAGSFNSIKR